MKNACGECGTELEIKPTLLDPLGLREKCTNPECRVDHYFDVINYQTDEYGFVDESLPAETIRFCQMRVG